MKPVKFGSFLILFFSLLQPWLTANDEVCLKNIEEFRAGALTALHRLDDNFKDADWNYKKYQEMVYNPLWQAAVKRRDQFSDELKTEGDILYRRYRLSADQGLQRAETDMEASLRELKTVRQGLVGEDSCGGALQSENPSENISGFNNCMSLWNHETDDLIKEIEKLLHHYQKKQDEFSELLESKLSDTPSNHDTFEDRYYHHFFEFDLKTQTHFRRLIRQVQERFELKWPAETCCSACQSDMATRWDPVLSQLKLDPQGDSGVAGNLVNNARLKQAFERFEKEEKPEKKDNESKN